jgi:hypothetical protein
MTAAQIAREFTRLKDLQRLLRLYEGTYNPPLGTACLRRDVIEQMRKLAKLMTLYAVPLCLLLALLPSVAMAQEHYHPDETITGETARFYETWNRPDDPTVSCCNKMDCGVVSEVRLVGDRWEARRKDGIWLRIPPEKIEQLRDSPDGRSHMCSRGSTVYCFKLGAGI